MKCLCQSDDLSKKKNDRIYTSAIKEKHLKDEKKEKKKKAKSDANQEDQHFKVHTTKLSLILSNLNDIVVDDKLYCHVGF